MYIRNYGLPKTWLDKYQKSSATEYPWTSNMVKRLKNCINLNGGILSYLLITVNAIGVEKVTPSEMQNLNTVC